MQQKGGGEQKKIDSNNYIKPKFLLVKNTI